MGESLEVKWLEMCLNFCWLQVFFPIRGESRGTSPVSGTLLTPGPGTGCPLGRKRKMLWKIISRANRTSTFILGNLSQWVSSSAPSPLQVLLIMFNFGRSPFIWCIFFRIGHFFFMLFYCNNNTATLIYLFLRKRNSPWSQYYFLLA